MKILKRILKRIMVYIVIFMIVLSNTVAWGYNSEEVGNAISGYTLHLLTWGNEENLSDGGPRLRYTQGDRLAHPKHDDPEPELPWYYDCSSFAADMYNMVCNQELLPYGSSTYTIPGEAALDRIGPYASVDLKPGDLINGSGHVEVYIDDTHGTGGAHWNYGNSVTDKTTAANQVDCMYVRNGTKSISPEDGISYRIKESVASEITDLNTEFSATGSKNSGGGAGEFQKLDYSHFYFNGVPDGKYSLASKDGFFKLLINSLKDIIDYYIGLETYLVRMVFVGWTGIFDNILNWSVTTVLDTGAEEEAETGVKGVEVNKTETGDREVNIETLVFNKFKILDVNIFKAD